MRMRLITITSLIATCALLQGCGDPTSEETNPARETSSQAVSDDAETGDDSGGGEISVLSDVDLAVLYAGTVEQSMIQSTCVNCHIPGSIAGDTSLVFVNGLGNAAANQQIMTDYLLASEFNESTLLDKIQGFSHDGGALYVPTDSEYVELVAYLEAWELNRITPGTDVVEEEETGLDALPDEIVDQFDDLLDGLDDTPTVPEVPTIPDSGGTDGGTGEETGDTGGDTGSDNESGGSDIDGSDDSGSDTGSDSGGSGIQDLPAFYAANIETDIVQARCTACHVSGGLASGTDLVYTAGDGQATANQAVTDTYITTVGTSTLLGKISGAIVHTGGTLFADTTDEYANLESYANAVTAAAEFTVSLPLGGLHYSMADSQTVLALEWAMAQFSGLDTSDALVDGESQEKQALLREQLANGVPASELVRSLMVGEAFHQFLIDAADAQLHLTTTLKQPPAAVDPEQPHYPRLAQRYFAANVASDQQGFEQWYEAFVQGVVQAPLELIAYVVMQDRPYTDILTADYTMLNREMNEVYDAGVEFSADAPSAFLPGVNQGQMILDDQFSAQWLTGLGWSIESHGEMVAYPHSGLLNDIAFLSQSVASLITAGLEPDVARAHWVYRHFLAGGIAMADVCVTLDVDATDSGLEDCIAYRRDLASVAALYQQYDAAGWLTETTVNLGPAESTFAGLEDNRLPAGAAPLAWLGEQIADDPRFARATVEFWWPAIFETALLSEPSTHQLALMPESRETYDLQQQQIASLADQFRAGIAGGEPYNLKDLLVAMILMR